MRRQPAVPRLGDPRRPNGDGDGEAVNFFPMRKVLVILLLLAASAHAEKTLRWKQLAVTAHLDGDGKLHVQERHSIIFNGDWNGAERTFRSGAEDVIDHEDGSIEVISTPHDFERVKAALESSGLKPGIAEVTMKPATEVAGFR